MPALLEARRDHALPAVRTPALCGVRGDDDLSGRGVTRLLLWLDARTFCLDWLPAWMRSWPYLRRFYWQENEMVMLHAEADRLMARFNPRKWRP